MAAAKPRAVWTGSISFGLVNAPVRMYAAVSEQNLKFNLIHEKDGGRIGYQKICKLEDKTVPNEQIVKAYQVDERQLEMAAQLISQYQGEFDVEKYHDQYRERLMGVIEAKRSGEGVKQVVTAEKAPAPDLLAALQASLDEARGSTKPAARKP